MNLISHAIPSLQKLADRNPTKDNLQELIDIIIDFLKISQKFTIPAPNCLNITVTKSSIDFIRMPYPIMTVEYPLPTIGGSSGVLDPTIPLSTSSKRIVLAFDASKVDTSNFIEGDKIEKGIIATSIFYVDETKEWEIAPGLILYDPENEKNSDLLLNDEKYHISAIARAFKVEYLYATYKYLQLKNPENKNIIYDVIFNDTFEELCSLIKIIVLLNAKNINTINIEPNSKLNKKRIKNGNLPFYEYKTLDIFLSSATRKLRTKDINNYISNFKSSQKLHSVIGHFKVRKTGIFWWSSHQRGTIQKGLIEKNYNLKI